MTEVLYKLKDGEHVREIAAHFGFRSLDPIAEHPDNAAIVAERDGIDHLVPGDTFTVPIGRSGKKHLGTGRRHTITVSDAPGTCTVRLETAFRLPNGFPKEDWKPEDHTGDLAESPSRWDSFGTGTVLPVVAANVELNQDGGGLIFKNVTNRRGQASFPHLDDGKWVLRARPVKEELSDSIAKAEPTADHGLGFYEKKGKPSGKPKKDFPRNGAYEVEYRPLEMELTVSGGVVTGMTLTKDGFIEAAGAAPQRPAAAVAFWEGTGSASTEQQLLVDWKPDFIRRVKKVLRPFHRERRTISTSDPETPGPVDSRRPELIVLHQTTGNSIGGGLNTFLAPSQKSGAHFVNDLDGHIVRLADDRYYTQHAGGYRSVRAPNWRLETAANHAAGTNINDRAVGIENVHKEVTTGGGGTEIRPAPVYRPPVRLTPAPDRGPAWNIRNPRRRCDRTPRRDTKGPVPRSTLQLA